jgi:methylmalonyl-CoA/ethylmalonyl-CoA epimerase
MGEDMACNRVHHIGYVTASIATSADEYMRATGLAWDGRIFHDPLQMVRVTFLMSSDHRSAMIELVEPAGRRSPVNAFLRGGGGLHHICLEVDDLTAQIEASRGAGCALVRVPLPAVAFGASKIAWITTPAGQLIELLQRSESSRGLTANSPSE